MDIKKENFNRKRRAILLVVLSLMIVARLLGNITPNVGSLGQNNEKNAQLHSSPYENLLIDKV